MLYTPLDFYRLNNDEEVFHVGVGAIRVFLFLSLALSALLLHGLIRTELELLEFSHLEHSGCGGDAIFCEVRCYKCCDMNAWHFLTAVYLVLCET